MSRHRKHHFGRSLFSAANAIAHHNHCGACGYSWQARGHTQSARCPRCRADLYAQRMQYAQLRAANAEAARVAKAERRARETPTQRRFRIAGQALLFALPGLLFVTCAEAVCGPTNHAAIVVDAAPSPAVAILEDTAPPTVDAGRPAKRGPTRSPPRPPPPPTRPAAGHP